MRASGFFLRTLADSSFSTQPSCQFLNTRLCMPIRYKLARGLAVRKLIKTRRNADIFSELFTA